MKKTLVTAALFLPLFAFAQSKTVEEFTNSHKNAKDAISVEVNGAFFKLLPKLLGKMDASAKDMIKIVKHAHVLTLNNDSENRNAESLMQLKEKIVRESYDNLMEVKDGESKVHIFAKQRGDKLTDYLVFVVDKKQCVLVNLTGDIDFSKL